MTRCAFYSGSFDPVTNGHLDIIRRGARMVDRLVIGVGVHDAKAPLFDADARIAMLEEVTRHFAGDGIAAVEIVTFDDLAVDAAARCGAQLILRGLRNGTDLDYEAQMAGMNAAMAGDIETVFLASAPETRHIAANLVRQIARMGGDVRPFVPSSVAAQLAETFGNGQRS
ncbi:MAG: pantetheine-phosphate adenylyltransferase [Pseudomonadota bacterium]